MCSRYTQARIVPSCRVVFLSKFGKICPQLQIEFAVLRDKVRLFAELEEPTTFIKSAFSCCSLENLVTFPQVILSHRIILLRESVKCSYLEIIMEVELQPQRSLFSVLMQEFVYETKTIRQSKIIRS